MKNPSPEITDIAQRIHSFLTSILDKQGLATTLSADQSLAATGIVDSLFIIDLILFLETEFSLDFTKEEITPLDVDSIEQISKLVQMRLTKVSTAPGRDA